VRLRPRTLRGRLTLIFALVTLVLSALVGVLVDVQYRSALNSALDEALETRFLAAAQQLTHAGGSTVRPVIPDAESFAQVIDPDGSVVAASPRALRRRAVIKGADLEKAQDHQVTFVRDGGPRGERARLRAGPVGKHGQVVVVGTTLEETTRAQHRLELALAIGLPLLAALVTLAGWFLAGAALSPVQEMIEDADVISARSARQLSRRLTVPENAGDELAELARRLNHLLERIESALEHERMFLDDASHELRTPISIARGELELARLQTDASADPDTAAALDSALEEIDRLDHLAVSLLVLARTRSAGPPPQTPFDLADVARRAVSTATSVDGTRDVPLAVDVTGDAVMRGDAEAIERAVRNLVENALRYAHQWVTVVVGDDGAAAVIEVRDDGPGFPAAWLDQGVGRFAAGDSPQAHGGAGLGLAIVDAIAGSHGGTVEIGPAPDGHGAEVRLWLPHHGGDVDGAGG
jgi:two-component system OmpR family sensor kinase